MLPPAPVTGNPQANPPPDWNHVAFPVTCARCGHDLHGQTEPKCPACALEFDWRDACPIEQLKCAKCGYHLYGLRETRCPECGECFDWRLVLLDYRRRQKDLFEYRWRDRPVGSLVRTWRRALTPLRFWRKIDIHDQPQLGPLVLFLMIMVGACLIIDAVCSTITSAAWWLGDLSIAQAARLLLSSISLPRLHVLVAITTWIAATFASLVILRQSMSLCRVRTIHVIRACVYACGPVLLFAVLGGGVLEILLVYSMTHRGGSWDIYVLFLNVIPWLFPAFFLSVALFALWSLRCAYKHYIRMRHSAGVAISSQLIAILATLSAAAVVAMILSS